MGNVYLSSLLEENQIYLDDHPGKKKVTERLLIYIKHIKNNQLNSIQAPHIPGLRIKDIIYFARAKSDIYNYIQNSRMQINF